MMDALKAGRLQKLGAQIAFRHPMTHRNAETVIQGGFVKVRGARQNNLKDIDVEIPRDALVVFTGVSGSGKSSLAFGTLYAEAQRRYLESVSPYARRAPALRPDGCARRR
jgi:hypothetical protein